MKGRGMKTNAQAMRAPNAPRRHGRWATGLAVLAGLTLVVFAWWRLWGDSIPAHRAMDAALEQWATTTAPAPAEVAQWRTDVGNVPVPDRGTLTGTWGVLHVPSWHERVRGEMPVKHGVSDRVLDTGAAGWIPETEAPGELGNFVLSAHRRTRGNSFLHTIDLVPGHDIVILEHEQAWLRFEIREHLIVPADDQEVILPVPGDPYGVPEVQLITLTTCGTATGGQWGNSHRVISHGQLTGWLYRHDGTPPEVAALRTGTRPA